MRHIWPSDVSVIYCSIARTIYYCKSANSKKRKIDTNTNFFLFFFFIYISVCVTNANCVVEEIYKTWPQERMCLIDNEKIRGKGTTWLSLPVKLFRWVSPFRDGVGGQYHTLHRKMHGKCRAKSCGRGCFEFITVIYSINVTVNLCCCGNTFVI